jgi:hypothetical protein
MDAAEAIGWIAYRVAAHLPRWPHEIYRLVRRWPISSHLLYAEFAGSSHYFELGEFPGTAWSLIRILAAESRGKEWKRLRDLGVDHIYWHYVDYCLEQLLKSNTAAELLSLLSLDKLQIDFVNPPLIEAAEALREALEAGKLSAVGAEAFTGREPRPLEPIAPSEWHFGVELTPLGEMREVHRLLLRHSVTFQTAQVTALWSAETGGPALQPMPLEDVPTDRTGSAGRPSSRHLVVHEFRRRAAEGELEPKLGAEAAYLSNWLSMQHPTLAQMAPASVGNAIRDIFPRPHKIK